MQLGGGEQHTGTPHRSDKTFLREGGGGGRGVEIILETSFPDPTGVDLRSTGIFIIMNMSKNVATCRVLPWNNHIQ